MKRNIFFATPAPSPWAGTDNSSDYNFAGIARNAAELTLGLALRGKRLLTNKAVNF